MKPCAKFFGMKNCFLFSAVRVMPNHFPKGFAARTEIDRDVEDFSVDDAHELVLRVVDLEVQTAQHTFSGCGLVVLDELAVDSCCREVVVVVGFHEVAAAVTEDGGLDDAESFDAAAVFGYVDFSHLFASFFWFRFVIIFQSVLFRNRAELDREGAP
jgi:hypothetical protein